MNPILLAASGSGVSSLVFLVLFLLYAYCLYLTVCHVAKRGEGAEVPIWVLVIVTVPILGMVAAFKHYPSRLDGE